MGRLGLTPLFEEVKHIVSGFTLLVKEEKGANGRWAVRRMIEARFQVRKDSGWKKQETGEVHWTKSRLVNGTELCIGVRFHLSGRSDLLALAMMHLRRAITGGDIDVRILVVPNDTLGTFMVNRGPRISDARRHVTLAKAEDLPLVIVGIEHDGPGPALPKRGRGDSGGQKTANRWGGSFQGDSRERRTRLGESVAS